MGTTTTRKRVQLYSFILNEDANLFAELDIIPTPDHVYRFYILTSKVEDPSDYENLQPQVIETIKRTGFTVLEWGGLKFKLETAKLNISNL